jgi:aryl-alcohol dehydrogenase-like predicted oxidoreductase
MKTRRLGRTGFEVSEVGYGAWGIGKGLWIGAEDAESLRALHRACDLGLNFVDTALAYGPHHSERLVGRLLKERRERIFVATKVPPKDLVWPAAPGSRAADVFPAAYVVECTEKSLRNLGVDVLDVQQLHVWRDEWLDEDGWKGALERLRRKGKVRHFGISINDHDPGSALKAVTSGLFDSVQVIYNVFDQSPEAELLPACRAHDVGVIVRVPLDEGGLTGAIRPDSEFPEGDFRREYFRGERRRQVFDRASALQALLGDEASTLPELALRFCLSQDAVSTVIPGMRRLATVEANVTVSDGRRLSSAMREKLRGHAWPRNFYD